jgi:cell division protein FtsB
MSDTQRAPAEKRELKKLHRQRRALRHEMRRLQRDYKRLTFLPQARHRFELPPAA